MKEYTYKGYTFRATDTLHASTLRPLYEIDDLKERGVRPFLTSVKDCKEYINECGAETTAPRTNPRKTNDSNLARLRMARGLTQEQLAELVGVQKQHVSRWERGERNPAGKNLLKLCQVLECQITDLLDE